MARVEELKTIRAEHRSALEAAHYEENLLSRIEMLEQRLADLERFAPTGLIEPAGTAMQLPGGLEMAELDTESLEIVDAGSAGATEQDWIAVEVGGNAGYIRVFATK